MIPLMKKGNMCVGVTANYADCGLMRGTGCLLLTIKHKAGEIVRHRGSDIGYVRSINISQELNQNLEAHCRGSSLNESD